MSIRLLTGDCRETLRTLEAGSCQAVITSPPYYGLRDYGSEPLIWGGDAEHEHEWGAPVRTPWANEIAGPSDNVPKNGAGHYRPKETGLSCPCGAWLGSLGLEPHPDFFVEHIVECFRHVRRVLRDDGVCWINLGDSMAGSGNGSNDRRPSGASLSKNDQKYVGQSPRRAHQGAYGDFTRPLPAKNLLMIPFRVAMALQQPYVVPTCVKSEVDRAWLAAMFDGEGTIGIRRFSSYREEKRQTYQDGFVVYTTVANNDVPLLDHCVAITGFGRAAIKQSAQAGMVDARGILSRRDNYGWRLDGNAAVDVIRAIYPYLISKRKQAMLAYTLDMLNKSGRAERGNQPVPAEMQAKRALLYDLIKRCNQREEVDLPDWLEEPKPKIEPGWYLRSVIPWLKRNSMPESVSDRPSTSVEYVFMLTKSARYFYDADAVRVSSATSSQDRAYLGKRPISQRQADMVSTGMHGETDSLRVYDRAERNRRNSDWFFESWQGLLLDEDDAPLVLVVNPAGFSGAHFATFAPKLVEPMVKASTREGDTVLDCFSGAGTVGLVADRLGRNAIGCELKDSYSEMSADRIVGDAPLFVDLASD
jgi:DNA modification methylase